MAIVPYAITRGHKLNGEFPPHPLVFPIVLIKQPPLVVVHNRREVHVVGWLEWGWLIREIATLAT